MKVRIPREEFINRIEKLRHAMLVQKLEAVFVYGDE